MESILRLTPLDFVTTFPYHFVLDQDCKFVQTGRELMLVFSLDRLWIEFFSFSFSFFLDSLLSTSNSLYLSSFLSLFLSLPFLSPSFSPFFSFSILLSILSFTLSLFSLFPPFFFFVFLSENCPELHAVFF